MTNNGDSLPGDEHDPEVSAQYRALAKETTPNDLDKIVLRAASKADKKPRLDGLERYLVPAGNIRSDTGP